MRTERFRGILLSTLLVTSLMVPLLSLFLSSQSVSASPGPGSGSATFNPTDDAEVVRGNPGSNYGTKTRVGIRSKNVSTYDIRGFLEFDISSLPPNTTIDSATLRLYQYYIGSYLAGVSDAEVREVDNDAWDEMVITWDDQPAMGSLLGTIVTAGPVYVWRELDVTSYVQSEFNCGAEDNLISFGLKCVIEDYDSSNRNAYFRSKEATDNFPELVVEYHFEKKCMPDLGQHCQNWCWAAAAANSFWWWAQNGYPELLDAPEIPGLDNAYVENWSICPVCGAYRRLLDEIAKDCGREWCMPVSDNDYFHGLQKFISDQGAALMVHEINDPAWVPTDPNTYPLPDPGTPGVEWRRPTLEDYQRELERCQDVLLWIDFEYEELDHVVTGVGFSYDNTWILVSDPWTTGAPDHNNIKENKNYDYWPVISSDPFVVWIERLGQTATIPKMVYISPFEPECGVEVTIEPEHKRGTPSTTLTFIVSVHNTGNIVDNYLLSVEPDGWPMGMENIWFEENRLVNVENCETRTTNLYVHIPDNAAPCTHKEIVVWAESEFCHATDNDNALVQVVSMYLHNIEPGVYPLEPDNWVDWTLWHEIYPIYSNVYLLHSWEDTDKDGVTSPGDYIDLMDESENITWYYVKDVTCTLVLEEEMFSPPDLWWYLEFEDGWDNYCSARGDPWDTQWNEIYPEFCNRYLLVGWDDTGEPYGKLSYSDWVLLVDKVTWEPLPFWLHVVEIVTDLVLCEEEIVEDNWTGTVDFSLKNLYTVNVEKILDLYAGSKLVVKFYTYGDGYENENVVENFTTPPPTWHVEENESARHPEGLGVKKARLDLTTADTGNVIETIASYTVTKVDLETRFMEIPAEWVLASPAERVELETEFMEIPSYWILAPS